MDSTQLAIVRVMLVGVIISMLLVIGGGIFDLYYYGNTIVDYTHFHGISPSLMVFNTCRGVIKLGIFALVLTQIVRVAIAGWFFVKLRDNFFVGVSGFIVILMVITLVWRI